LSKIHLEDEIWLDGLGFAYLEDTLETYKGFINGGRVGLLYNSGIVHIDAGSSSREYRKSPKRFYIRAKASLMVWWRTCFRNGADTFFTRLLAVTSYSLKFLLLIPVMCVSGLILWDGSVITSYFKGVRDGLRDVHAEPFRSLPPYCLRKKITR
jgi:hypothetical protein